MRVMVCTTRWVGAQRMLGSVWLVGIRAPLPEEGARDGCLVETMVSMAVIGWLSIMCQMAAL